MKNLKVGSKFLYKGVEMRVDDIELYWNFVTKKWDARISIWHPEKQDTVILSVFEMPNSELLKPAGSDL